MQMGELRGKTPEMVRKEVWAHVLAYNLIRTVMAQAAARTTSCRGRSASRGPCRPWRPSSRCSTPGRPAAPPDRLRLYHDLLDAIAAHRVADRPDRYEPRVKKRRTEPLRLADPSPGPR